MRISIKLLNGGEISPEIDAAAKVLELKMEIMREMNIPVEKQRLMFKGKPLQDHMMLHECGVTHDSKLILSVRDISCSQPNPNSNSVLCQSSPGDTKSNLRSRLLLLLRRHYSNSDAEKISDEFIRDLHDQVRKLSLDDIERIAKANLQNESSFK